jgi:hypothetical protein
MAGSLRVSAHEGCGYGLSGLTVRRHWCLQFAAYVGAVLFAVTISAVLFRIVSVEYVRDPVTAWCVSGW